MDQGDYRKMKNRTVYYHEESQSIYMVGFDPDHDVARCMSWGCIGPLRTEETIIQRYHEAKKTRYFFGSENVRKRHWAKLMGIPRKLWDKKRTPPIPPEPKQEPPATPPVPTVIVTTRPEDWRNKYLTPGQRERLQPTDP